MPAPAADPVLADLRARVARTRAGSRHAALRRCRAAGSLLGALHEVAGGGGGAIDGATAALFAAGIAARTKGKVLWCVTRQDPFAPALARPGSLPPG